MLNSNFTLLILLVYWLPRFLSARIWWSVLTSKLPKIHSIIRVLLKSSDLPNRIQNCLISYLLFFWKFLSTNFYGFVLMTVLFLASWQRYPQDLLETQPSFAHRVHNWWRERDLLTFSSWYRNLFANCSPGSLGYRKPTYSDWYINANSHQPAQKRCMVNILVHPSTIPIRNSKQWTESRKRKPPE